MNSDKNTKKKTNENQENFDAKQQIRRPAIGCKWNKLAYRTNSKFKRLIIRFTFVF